MTSLLMGFIGDSISYLKTINLGVTFRDNSCSKTILTEFMMVGISLVYNIIIGQPTLNR